MNFSLYYRKNKNEELFHQLENSTLGLEKLQNYVPLYEKFFSLNSSNFNSINLNQKYYLHSINEEVDTHSLEVNVADNSNNLLKRSVFCKFSPLLDPLKYLTGKYDLSGNSTIALPQFNTSNAFPKLLDKNNTAYVDAFFTYLSSQLLHNYDFLNSIDYYGAFICQQKKFIYNIADDIDYLNENDFFHENKNRYYAIENDEHSKIFNVDSRTNKKKLMINDKLDKIELDTLSMDDFVVFSNAEPEQTRSMETLSGKSPASLQIIDLSDVCIYNHMLKKSTSISSASTYSSKSSNTSDGNEGQPGGDEHSNDASGDESCGDDGGDDGGDDSGDDGYDCNDYDDDDGDDDTGDIYCSILNFPVQMITLEKCENTLDYLMEEDLLEEKEWVSCLFQIIISLAVFQKAFSFTHNDLHTNNVMYIPTEKQFLYYTFNNITYKVPTYGKIYKIIDFGRAIYKFNGQLMCSDSFHPKGDAGSQYNCEPYMDENKPRLEPNPSFDLCRLACCLYDHFVEDIFEAEDIINTNKLASIINDWLIDDKGRNILYKNSGEERYPEFKLYKMIARTVHSAIPSAQLGHELFKNYITSKKKLNKNAKIMNLDNIPNFQ
jgi:hypothetical protein